MDYIIFSRVDDQLLDRLGKIDSVVTFAEFVALLQDQMSCQIQQVHSDNWIRFQMINMHFSPGLWLSWPGYGQTLELERIGQSLGTEYRGGDGKGNRRFSQRGAEKVWHKGDRPSRVCQRMLFAPGTNNPHFWITPLVIEICKSGPKSDKQF